MEEQAKNNTDGRGDGYVHEVGQLEVHGGVGVLMMLSVFFYRRRERCSHGKRGRGQSWELVGEREMEKEM